MGEITAGKQYLVETLPESDVAMSGGEDRVERSGGDTEGDLVDLLGEDTNVEKMVEGDGEDYQTGRTNCTYECESDGGCKVSWTRRISQWRQVSYWAGCRPLRFGGGCHESTPRECRNCHGNANCPAVPAPVSKVDCKYRCQSNGGCTVSWTRTSRWQISSGSVGCFPRRWGGRCGSGIPSECSKNCHGNARCP